MKHIINQDNLNALLNNVDFYKQLSACASQQEAVRLFADHGLALTEGEVEELMTRIHTLARKLTDKDGSLNEEDMEQIAGGNGHVCGWFGVAPGEILESWLSQPLSSEQ